LVDIALSRHEGELASNGALNVSTGARTGRSPKDRFIVKDGITEKTVDWNTINQAISPEKFDALLNLPMNIYINKNAVLFLILKLALKKNMNSP